jgi:hypothetical protein
MNKSFKKTTTTSRIETLFLQILITEKEFLKNQRNFT